MIWEHLPNHPPHQAEPLAQVLSDTLPADLTESIPYDHSTFAAQVQQLDLSVQHQLQTVIANEQQFAWFVGILFWRRVAADLQANTITIENLAEQTPKFLGYLEHCQSVRQHFSQTIADIIRNEQPISELT